MTPQRWGAVASFTLAVTFIVGPLLYLVGDLRNALWVIGYDVADILSGPVWAASLVTAVLVMREQIGDYAPRRMSLALAAAIVSGVAMVTVAMMRSTNREYFTAHLNYDGPTFRAVSLVVPAVVATGLHFLGWSMVLIGSAGWTTPGFSRLLSIMYIGAGLPALFAYLQPDELNGLVIMLTAFLAVVQGIALWKGEASGPLPQIKGTQKEAQPPPAQPDQGRGKVSDPAPV